VSRRDLRIRLARDHRKPRLRVNFALETMILSAGLNNQVVAIQTWFDDRGTDGGDGVGNGKLNQRSGGKRLRRHGAGT
jgi:hypothetical protein